ncbi:MAG: hypothetical protein QXM68_01510 [Candidatus Aenigmatarchaeota archaeon]|nr:hypothetical protein [Candidatus Aenigmarchaeota archaeon]
MKGISAFVSIVLIIALTISVGAIFSRWFTSYIRTTSQDIEDQSKTKITCSNAGIALSRVTYNQTSGYIYGYIRNTDLVSLGDIDVEIFLKNATRIFADINLSLTPGEQNSFSYNLNTANYDYIRVKTNCSNVYDYLMSEQILTVN